MPLNQERARIGYFFVALHRGGVYHNCPWSWESHWAKHSFGDGARADTILPGHEGR